MADAPVHIFLDLDGVMADFDRHAHEQGKYDSKNKLKWDELDYQWWSTMPAFEGARGFYDAVKKLGTVRFLTAPVLTEGCFSGKAAWVQKFLPERGKSAMKDLIICAGIDKKLLARPHHILVDDREANIKDWVAAGGIGILHEGDFTVTLQKLEDAIANLPAPVTKQADKPKPPGITPK